MGDTTQYATNLCNSAMDIFNLTKVEELAARDDIERSNRERDIVLYMNQYYGVVKDTSATFVEKTINKGEVEYIKRNQRGFKNALLNKSVTFREKKVVVTKKSTVETIVEQQVNLYDLWIKSKYRCEFSRFGFGEKVSDDTFNLFHGLRIREANLSTYKAIDAEPLIHHIKSIWCKGDEKISTYIIKYLAHIVQRPFVKTKVAFVMRSRQGSGKGTILEKLQDIFGSYFKTTKPKDFTGDFNGVLADALILFLDECLFSGDKKVAAELKTLITQRDVHINTKYLPTCVIDNYINVFIATNYSWCAPIEESDRRYFAIELDDKFGGKTTEEAYAYFETLRAIPYQAFYLYLMAVDLTGFVPYIFPITPLMREQKGYTMDSITAWLYYVLTDGSLTEGLTKKIKENGKLFDKKDLHDAYKLYCNDRGGHYIKAEQYNRFFARLSKIVPFKPAKECKIELPSTQELKAHLRKHLDDAEFPLD